MPYEVITFGEAMIRLSPPSFRRLEQARSLDLLVGGAELNTAAGLVRLGRSAAWVSRLTQNPLGRLIANHAGFEHERRRGNSRGAAGSPRRPRPSQHRPQLPGQALESERCRPLDVRVYAALRRPDHHRGGRRARPWYYRSGF